MSLFRNEMNKNRHLVQLCNSDLLITVEHEPLNILVSFLRCKVSTWPNPVTYIVPTERNNNL